MSLFNFPTAPLGRPRGLAGAEPLDAEAAMRTIRITGFFEALLGFVIEAASSIALSSTRGALSAVLITLDRTAARSSSIGGKTGGTEPARKMLCTGTLSAGDFVLLLERLGA